MSKIDCSVTVNFLRGKERMCESFKGVCEHCPLREASRYTEYTCSDYMCAYPEASVKIVQEWSDKHPPKTRLEDLLEKYPKLPLRDDGLLDFLPTWLGYCEDCRNCRCFENISSDVCWNEPVDGGATGKAVE